MSNAARRFFRKRQRDALRIEAQPPRHVAICTPLQDTVHTAFAVSLLQMTMHTMQVGPSDVTLSFHNYASSVLPFARNAIAKSALEAGATHLLWIDSDMEFQPDTLIRFLKDDLPIVGVNASMRRPPHRNCARLAEDRELVTSVDSSGLEKVERTGFGIVMVKREVFAVLDLPWFAFEWLPEHGVFRGEDYYFFLKAKAAGFEIVVDQDVSRGVRHWGSFGYSPVIKALGESFTEKTNE